MAFTYTIYTEHELILERYAGHLTALDIQQYLKQLWADEAYDKSYRVIVDIMQAELVLTRQEVMEISKFLFDAPEAGGGWLVIIATRPVELALSFLFQSQSATMQKYKLGIFSTWEAVVEYLDLSPSAVKDIFGTLPPRPLWT